VNRRTPRIALIAALAASSAASVAQEPDPEQLAAVKAAFLYNFVRYTTWPASSFEAPDSPYRVVVVDSAEIAEGLGEIVRRTGSAAGRPVEVIDLADDTLDAADVRATLRGAHVVYLGDAVPARRRLVMDAIAGHDVLTVGDPAGFAAGGGMIGLRRDGNRIVFDANPRAIRATRLTVSSRVLQLARIVDGGGTE
jgi:hypothetical protein